MLLIAIKYFVERKLAGRRAFNQISRELEFNTDRELADMGLGRGDVYPIATQAGREAEEAVRARAAKAKHKARALADIGAPPQVYY